MIALKDWTPNRDMPERVLGLARSLDDGIYNTRDDAEGRQLSPLEVLERADPSEDQPEWLQGTTVLQRLMLAYGVRTRDDPARGIPASRVGDFFNAGGGRGALLFPLWVEQVCRDRQAGMFDRFYSSTQVSDGNGALRPHTLASQIAADALQTSILPLLVGVQELSDGRPYTSFLMTEDSTKTLMRRRTEHAPSAVFSLTGTERTNRLEEFGIELQISYKALREYALPALQQHLTWVAQRNDRSKEQVAYETQINGDGGSAAATNTNVSALTGGVANTVTYGNIMEFLRLYEADGNYVPSIMIGTSAVLQEFDTSTFGSGNYPTFGPLTLSLLGQVARPEARMMPPMHARSYCTANKALFCDRNTLRMVYTPLLVERDRVIDQKFERIVISEETSFDHLRDGGRRTLDVAS